MRKQKVIRDINFNILEILEYENDSLISTTQLNDNKIVYVKTPKHETHYKDGLKHGEHKTFFENGNISFYANYIQDKMDGIVIHYFPNGKISYMYEAKQNYIHGQFTSFNELGHLIIDETCNKGKKQGTYKQYYLDTGYPRFNIQYHENKFIGKYIVFHNQPNNQILVDAFYNENQELHGTIQVYHPNGKLAIKAILENNTILDAQTYDENNNPFQLDKIEALIIITYLMHPKFRVKPNLEIMPNLKLYND